MIEAIILEIINSILLIVLLSVYIKNYKEVKMDFTLGLIIFAGFLLLQNLAALYFHLSMIDYYSSEVIFQATILNVVQTIALIVLNYVTWKN
jgi:hypothetical protein